MSMSPAKSIGSCVNNEMQLSNDWSLSSDSEKSVLRSTNKKISLREPGKSTLQHELDQLNNESEVLKNLRANIESRTAPIWMLPNEVLSHIFELGASDQEKPNDSSPSDYLDFQTLVSHVSRRFRDVAIKTPTLWSTIHVLVLAKPRLDYLKTCLNRSSPLPFSIRLEYEDEDFFDYPSGDPNFVIAAQIMTLVKNNMYRLERFMARLCTFRSLHRVMQFLNEPAPQLRALELYEADCEQTFNEDTTLIPPQNLHIPLALFDGQVPKLTKVILGGVHVAWSQCNFKNLTVLNLGYHIKHVRPTYQELYTIIKDSPSLRELSLQGSAPLLSEEVTDSSLYAPFILDSLKKLRVSDISSDYSSILVSLLHAPNLKFLILSKLYTNDFSSLFDRIAGPPALFPNLVSLKLVSIKASDASAVRLLRAHPRLEWLGLYAFHGCPRWVTLLEGRDSSRDTDSAKHLCPTLKCLRCVEIDLDEINDTLIRRQKANIPLPRLELHRDKENSSSRTSALQWLEQNVDVKFIDPSDYDSDDECLSDGTDSVSEGSTTFHYSNFSDGLDYDDEEEEEDYDYDYDDEDEDVDYEDEDEDDYGD